MENEKTNLDLTLFGGDAEACPQPSERGEIPSGETQSVPGNTRREDISGDINEAAAEPSADGGPDAGDRETSAEDGRKREYDDFVRTHKDIDEKRIQDLINRRFKETKSLEEEVKRLSKRVRDYDETAAKLAEKYGVKGEETSSVLRAFLNDARFAPRGAETGKKAEDAENMNAETAQNDAPPFDPKAESDNGEYLKLLNAGVSADRAYMLLHIDELLAETARRASENAERETVARLREKGARPAENGVSQGSGFIIKNDVSRLTKKDREEAIQRALRGETVTFRD